MAKKQNFFYAVGRRKSASARVRLFKRNAVTQGKGENLVNDLAAEKYFPGSVAKILLDRPFVLTETLGKYYFTAKVIGSGKNGQLQAVVHGVARTLSLADREKFRSPLKKAGLLTRDPRERERRMVGTGGKARRAKQSPKR